MYLELRVKGCGKMRSIVAFADILGTTKKVEEGSFSELELLDFVNPVGVAALHNKEMYFAVFSDSVIISCLESKTENFVSVMSFLYSQWFSDSILVRCGVSVGEINWIDDNTDPLFHKLSNLSYARVYGTALIKAYHIEQRSGPGGICYLDEVASDTLIRVNPNYVLEGATDSLVWTKDSEEVDYWIAVFNMQMERERENSGCRRHIKATLDYFQRLKISGKSVSTNKNACQTIF